MLAGSGKIGKSRLSLDLCVNVAAGGRLREFSSGQCDVLYLALEDNCPRLQGRLNKIKADSVDISRLKPATAAFGISSGLLEKTHSHLNERPDTKLIVIDTLERIRDSEFDKNIYACDRRDTVALREITGKRRPAQRTACSSSKKTRGRGGTRSRPSPTATSRASASSCASVPSIANGLSATAGFRKKRRRKRTSGFSCWRTGFYRTLGAERPRNSATR
ncbi:MAG: helicase RepA family protein [Clostridiales bacterium]|nr:helicase RepA family protein [Clostridiales bacterium]